jgi:UDP-N-acetyl-D-mannosaminuronic acid transferase (WecB/TagA/CpsF family)
MVSEIAKQHVPMTTIHILGIPFYNGPIDDCYKQLAESGGLLTVPSGPGLASIPTEPSYYASVRSSDLVIADSGYMALIWNKLSKKKVNRISGLAFISHFLEAYPRGAVQKTVFLVNPSEEEQRINVAYLASQGVPVQATHTYIAPMYPKGEVFDPALVAELEEKRPHWVFLNIGGGTQEILGAYLKQQLSYRPAIVCTGAAIAFKTGQQVAIPQWVDAMYLGWLWRIGSSPSKYIGRYWHSFSLAKLLWKYKEQPFPYAS